jgi:hypothetical protein
MYNFTWEEYVTGLDCSVTMETNDTNGWLVLNFTKKWKLDKLHNNWSANNENTFKVVKGRYLTYSIHQFRWIQHKIRLFQLTQTKLGPHFAICKVSTAIFLMQTVWPKYQNTSYQQVDLENTTIHNVAWKIE